MSDPWVRQGKENVGTKIAKDQQNRSHEEIAHYQKQILADNGIQHQSSEAGPGSNDLCNGRPAEDRRKLIPKYGYERVDRIPERMLVNNDVFRQTLRPSGGDELRSKCLQHVAAH